MTSERKSEVFGKMLSWIFEHVKEDKELFRILHEQLGMTRDEFHDNGIDSLDYLFETPTIDETVGKIAILHLHQEDDDYYFTSEYNNTFFKTAKLYQRYWKHGDDNLTIDTIAQMYFGAQESIDPITFSVLTNAIEHDDRVNVVIKIDMDENSMSVLDKNRCWKTYCLEDVLQALGVVERSAGQGVSPYSNRMFQELMEWNHIEGRNSEVTEAPKEQIPAM